MSNFPLSYKLSWLPRFLSPSLAGDRKGFAARQAEWIEPVPRHTARLLFAGDLSAVANRTAPTVDPALRDLFASADLVVGNCESPVVERPRFGLGTRLGIRHAMTARFLREALEAVGIVRERLVLSIANNHALDQGVEGFRETLEALAGLGIRTIGLAGEPVARVVLLSASFQGQYRRGTPTPNPSPQGGGEAAAPKSPSPLRGGARGGGTLTVGFMAFTQWRNAGESDFAGRVNVTADPASWPRETMQACDLLCAVPHWDWEFRHFPRAETRALARRLAQAGAGLIVGGHAHVVQPLERIGGALVAYGLGDLLGTAFARQPWPGRIGAVLAVDISLDEATRGRIAGYRMHPFFRLCETGRERLVPVEALDVRLRDKVVRRLAAVMGAEDAA
ncbi:CapA family protein [Ollibium composti]|uniref:CapA family protein n=1 Tax=Ollibium composti TaxID=2675109 RepID=A0ABY2Q4I8_9HYPH|nr:CapA family protein [Mesorhizobium composti]THF56042.1 CapA family protein [Mesorhizobium composti]